LTGATSLILEAKGLSPHPFFELGADQLSFLLAVYNNSMANGLKTGGRTAGTPNKMTQLIFEKLTELGCDPIEGMAHIAMDTLNPLEVRARMFAELAQYVAPKRKSVEIASEDRERIVFNIGIPVRHQVDATLEKFPAPILVR